MSGKGKLPSIFATFLFYKITHSLTSRKEYCSFSWSNSILEILLNHGFDEIWKASWGCGSVDAVFWYQVGVGYTERYVFCDMFDSLLFLLRWIDFFFTFSWFVDDIEEEENSACTCRKSSCYAIRKCIITLDWRSLQSRQRRLCSSTYTSTYSTRNLSSTSPRPDRKQGAYWEDRVIPLHIVRQLFPFRPFFSIPTSLKIKRH